MDMEKMKKYILSAVLALPAASAFCAEQAEES